MTAPHLPPTHLCALLALALLPACASDDAGPSADADTETETDTDTDIDTDEGADTNTDEGTDGSEGAETGTDTDTDTGTDADTGTDGADDGGLPGGQCPSGVGPDMVKLPEGYCIDSTEVTREQYATWLDSRPSVADQPALCAWNEDFSPLCGWPPGSNALKPVVCIDWCDAHAYCEAAGKRLCGRVGGGASAYEDWADPARSQWFNACSSGGSYDFVYGNEHDGAACRGADEDMWAWIEVGSLDSCQSPDPDYAGVYDLSGNAMEWEDSCDADAGAMDNCRLRGGSFNNSGNGLRCDMGESLEFSRSAYYVGVGFRCCAG